MQFDINEVVAQMLGAIKDTVRDNWSVVKNGASDYFQDHKSRLELLASLRLHDQISQDFFEKRLSDEEHILESELHSIAIITKAVAQKAANAAIQIFQNSIVKALGI
jgi:hypothetical protein